MYYCSFFTVLFDSEEIRNVIRQMLVARVFWLKKNLLRHNMSIWETASKFDISSFHSFSKNLEDITIKGSLAVAHNMVHP